MSKIRDRARNARYIARHPVQTWRNSPAAIGRSNRRGQAARERGRASRLSGVSAAVSSRAPFYRNRINRSTGRKNRDNGFMHSTRNEGLARMKAASAPGGLRAVRAAERENTGPRAVRAMEITDRAREARARAQVRQGRDRRRGRSTR